jgi:tripeptide aminopeptidase
MAGVAQRLALACAAATLLSATPASAQPAKAVEAVRALPAYKRAVADLDRGHDRFVEDIIALTEIPAPPFGEEKRAAAFRDMLQKAGLSDVRIDAVGNVIARRRGTAPAGQPAIVISAHLDTVFPADTDVKVRRTGTRLAAPGIGDDSRGLAALIAYVRALDAGGIKTRHDILFVGTVGEEGQGDLRGVRHLLTKELPTGSVKAFVSMDGLDPARITNGGVGSKRYRIIFRGPGGHSYSAFGIVNPMTAMSRAVVDLYAISLPARPKTTYSASVTGGGTSVNSIPNEVFMEFDMRSEDATALVALEKQLLAIVQAAADAENAARSTRDGKVSVEPKVIGDRPAGRTPDDAELVRTAIAASEAAGFAPALGASSTDSNLPMSLGIPAITMGSGGSGGRAHALDEYIDVEKTESLRGLAVGLTTLIALAQPAR